MLISFLCVLCLYVVDLTAQDFKQLHPGVEYAQVEQKLGTDPVKINLLRLDLKKVRLDVHHALDKASGLETTSSIANRKGAVAAINAGFFRLDKSEWAGEAAGVLEIDGQLISESTNNRIAIGIRNFPLETAVDLVHIDADAIARFGKDSKFTFDGINRERKANEIVLFTPEMGQRTGTSLDGLEIVLTGCTGQNDVVTCKKAGLHKNSGNLAIPEDGLVISIGGQAIEKSSNIANFVNEEDFGLGSVETSVVVLRRRGDSIINFKLSGIKYWEDITNGVPQLIKNGKIDITWEQEKASKAFVETRHPRTAVAKLKDGKFLMMTVDGRQPGVSVGMSLQELAEYLFSLGAVDAMNLDGGGSTTMFLDGKVVNTPSDKEGERKIGDAIVVTLRKPGKR